MMSIPIAPTESVSVSTSPKVSPRRFSTKFVASALVAIIAIVATVLIVPGWLGSPPSAAETGEKASEPSYDLKTDRSPPRRQEDGGRD